MANKYNSRTTVFSGIPNISYTLALGAGGAAATPVTLGTNASGTPFPDTTLAGLTTGYNGTAVTNRFVVNDQPVLKSFGVFVNFADGLLWNDSDGPPVFAVQLLPVGGVGIQITRGSYFRIDSFNTMFPLDMALDTQIARSAGITANWEVVVGRPSGRCSEVTFATNGISTVWNGLDVRFSYRAEFEHTYPLVV